ncbi:FAD-dependent monooxygenase [Psychrobacter sp. TAE2020]|uniref:FAD binding domain-containing protein n=1 Tax=Psychrobacter sp. TAE2020 TaxID=2846762 RepID=UPI002B49D611|nr:FAD-dependent monooxygenase [Psychrobacter sp. TAE2020]
MPLSSEPLIQLSTVPSINKRAIIIGGSLAGLFSGMLLRTIGWQVDIYERSTHQLDSRGGGVVLQAEVIAAFKQLAIDTENLGVVATERYYLYKDGGIEKVAMRQTLSSWNILYRSMHRNFPNQHYHQGKTLAQVLPEGSKVTAVFTDGTHETADLLIGADGPNSTVRQQLLPTTIPQYAGYVAYRGLVDEANLQPAAAKIFTERFVFYDLPNSHILAYVIPGENESLVAGKRRFNWVWYVNYDELTELPALLTDKNGQLHTHSIPPAMMAPAVERTMRDYANLVLVDPFKTLIAATKEPFVQSILDLTVPRMAFDNIALIGDAAFIPRPHTAASTAKAAANALALVAALDNGADDINKALQAWQVDQLAAGNHLCKHGRRLGG